MDDNQLEDGLSGIGLQLTLDASDGLVRVLAIECGGPCWYYVDARVRPGGEGKDAAQDSALVDKPGMRQVEPFDILMAVDGTEIARLDGPQVSSVCRSRQEIAGMLVGATGTTCRLIPKSILYQCVL